MENIREYLDKYGQSQLLTFIDELSDKEKENLINDINNIDFEQINTLYKNSFIDEDIDLNKITPMTCVVKKNITNIDEYIDKGKTFVKEGKYAVLIMAGGMGSRLGCEIPKGCLEVKNISLFESYINQLKKVHDELGIYIHLYIMTSTLNNDETIRFFEDHNYFWYPKENIHFFMQGELPIVDKQGKILLKDKSHVLFGPNGNGNVFSALKSSNLLSHMIDNNIQKVLFMPIDNILSILADYQLLGYSLINNHKLITKTIFKEDAYGKEWLFCLYNNKPFVLPAPYITDEIRFKQDKDGNFLYRDINIAYHLIDIDELKKYADVNLKYHRAFKNNKYIDVDGNYVTSNENNSYKFEQFIFDAFSYSDDMILYRVEKDEFFPIKVQEDINKLNKKDI